MRLSNSLKVLTPLLAALLFLATPAVAAVITVTVETDKPSYILGKTVTITGTVTEDTTAKANVYVSVEVRDPAGVLRFADVVKTDTNGAYSTSFRLAENLPTGTYKVKAVYAGVSDTETFEVATMPTFTVTLTPETIVVPIGFYETTTVQLKAVAGYGRSVTLSAMAVDGLSVTFTEATGVPDFQSIALVTASLDAVKGTYTLTVTAIGEDGTVVSKNLTVVIADAPPALATLLSKIDTLNETVSKLESDISGLKTDVVALKTDIAALKDSVSSLATRLMNAETSIESLTTDVNNLKASVDSLRDSIDALTTRIDNVQGTIGGLSGAAYGAIVLAIISLILAIYALVTLRRRLAA